MGLLRRRTETWNVSPISNDRKHPLESADSRVMKVRDVLRRLAADGWILVRTRGSHRQFRHPTKSGLVTLAGSSNDDLAPGT